MKASDCTVDILMGPTASGKTALAIASAQRVPTVIINADAMQMYDGLRIISARPNMDEMAAAEHVMYGVWDAYTHGSAQAWLEQAAAWIRSVWDAGKRPLLVGGTGMYIRALMQGFSPVSPVPPEVRAGVAALLQAEGTEGLRRALMAEDAAMAARLEAGDTQRMARALEVVRASGKSLAVWQAMAPVVPLPQAQFTVYALMPERQALYARINARFAMMMDAGALEEARKVQHMPRHLPMMQAVGLPELLAHVEGAIGYEEAVMLAQQHTRNYAKRQLTWIRNQCPDARDAMELCR